jgi:hypothetical protein
MAKPEVVVNVSQLLNAFKRHKKIYYINEEHDSCQLLLFYAVEAGLKSKFLRDRAYQTTLDFKKVFGESKKHGHGHKICEWISELKISAHVAGFSEDTTDPIENVHEKLRYGASLSGAVGKKQIAYLRSITTYLTKNL